MPSRDLQDLWTRLKSWFAVHAPDRLETLAPGATDKQIAETETRLSLRFPADFKASYRIHNGQLDIQQDLMDGREFLSLQRIEEEWNVWKGLLDSGEIADFESEPVGPIRIGWWNEKWIPITHDGGGNHDCLDLAPAEGGNVGQIIDFWHDDATREIKAPSFGDWFAAFVEGCENGSYVYSDEYGILQKKMLKLILAEDAWFTRNPAN